VLARYRSEALNDYYWGVRPAESGAALPAYAARDGLSWQVGARASYYLSKHWRIAASLQYERLSDTVRDSPLTKEDAVIGYFAGFAYQF
jgi:outer membrane protein